MKGNNGTGNVEERDLWQTDEDLFNKLDKQYKFDFDCCANKNNTKCEMFSNNFEEYNESDISNFICWMNPPFTKAKEMFKHFFKEVKKGVCIYRCDNMETKVWQEIILNNATWILIPKGRWSYNFFEYTRGKVKNKGSRFPSALIGFNVEPPKNVEGKVLYLK